MKLFLQIKGTRAQFLSAFAVAVALTLVPTAGAQEKPKNLYLVSVGITNAVGQSVLKATKKDALDMAKWAQSQQGKLFSKVQVTTLTDNNATKANITNALAVLKTQAKAGDYVMLYVSCHGDQAAGGEYYFCAYDGNMHWNQVKAVLANLAGFKVVILDTCHAAAATTDKQLVVFAACKADQLSSDGSSANGNSVYTKYLLEGLYGKADSNKNGLVSLNEAAQYASTQLDKSFNPSRPAGKKQNSVLLTRMGLFKEVPLAQTPGYLETQVATSPTSDIWKDVVKDATKTTPQLSGTTWKGSESLSGFGKLTFELKADGKAVMIDAKSTVPGTWTANGNQVTLAFAQVGATYQGTVNGKTMSGQATAKSGGKWTFSVSQ